MGIRFFCPKGHKLNVKEFQAGRVGVCPTCGEKVRIPLESTRPSSKQRRTSQAGGAAVAVAEPAGEAMTLELVPQTPEMAEMSAEIPLETPTTAPADPTDPLAEGGEVVWYVRPASGGQFGPATPDVMRDWLADGRVGADSLVWREGWRDWQTAGDVFPQLSQGRTIPAIVPAVPRPAVAAAPSAAPPLQRRTGTRNTRMIVIASLAAVVVLLSIILLVVVLNR
jgi:hypothetical protein